MKKDWTYKKLGEVAEIKAGFTPSSSELHEAGEYPYYKVSDMNTTGNEVFLISTLSYVKQSKKYFPKGSIAFPKNGAAIATNKKRILKYDSIVDLNTGVCIFDSDILPKFGYYWFQNIDFRNYTRGGALPTLDIKTISLKKIPIPPLSIQHSMVAELDLLHSVISKKKEQLRELDNLALSLFYEMFGDPIINSMGWEIKKFAELFKLKSGDGLSAKMFENGPYPVYGGNGISGQHCSYNMDGNYIIIGRVGVYCGNVRNVVGKFWLTDNAFQLFYDEDNNNPIFVTKLLTYLNLNQYANQAAQPVISNITLKDILVPLPPLSLQQSFAAKVSAIEAQKQAVQQSIREIEALLAERMDNYFG